ncbi:MAG: cbb3-type cytochrome c oxidase subunit I, partial [Cyanobacteria bacterium P01_G01_bin.4]
MSNQELANQAYNRLIWAHGVAALVTVGYTLALGLAIALKFHWPDLMSESSWVTWGRLRYAHTQGIFFGWLGNAFLAFLYYATPRLARRPPTGLRLGWMLFFVWNFLLVLPGWVLVQAGVSQPLEWAEFPLVTDAVAIFAFLLIAVQFVRPFFSPRIASLYVSGWYILGGLVFTLLAYPIGNFVPEIETGAKGATFSGLWIHDAVGLFVTPLALSIAYLVIPTTTGKPIFSHFLSMLGFWMLFMIYPLNGTHHYVFSSIPMEAQIGAIVASVYLGANVILVVSNLLLSLRGCAAIVVTSVPLRFVWLGVISYLVVSLQGAMQALMPVNRFVHFTDWVIGHAHLAMIGFASFVAIGGMLHVWERVPGFRYQTRFANAAFWMLVLGLLLMFLDLTIAGLVQGQLWESSAPFIESVKASSPFWLIRSISGVILIAGFTLVAAAMLTGPLGEPVKVSEETTQGSQEEEPHGPAWLRGAYVITAFAGVGMFGVSFLVLGVLPNVALEKEIQQTKPGFVAPLTASELRGREIYAREGCINCHSQLVR